ncbi:hypothetical protein ABZ752_22760 [Streptomyces roseifaciens]
MKPRFDMGADAVAISDAARRLAHATHPADRWPGVEYIGDLYSLAGILDPGLGSLDQTLSQAADYVRTEAAAGRLRQGRSRHVHITAGAAAHDLDAAAQALANARSLLARAQGHLSSLTPAEEVTG